MLKLPSGLRELYSKVGEDRVPAPIPNGLVMFPKVTQLDLTGPLQVFQTFLMRRCI